MMPRFSKFLLTIAALASASAAFAYQNPGAPLGHVNDYANILNEEEKTFLETKLSLFRTETGTEVAIATVPSLGGDTIENFAVELFEDWKMGDEKKDTGLLILVAPAEREVRIEVGYGLEPVVTDADSFSIIRDVITPHFKGGNYFLGLDGAVDRIIGLVERDPEAVRAAGVSESAPKFDFFYLVFFVLAFGVHFLAIMAHTKSWWLGGVFGLVLGAVFIGGIGAIICAAIGLAVDFILSKWSGNWFRTPKGPRGGGPWIMGGPGFGGRGGGGFGGFGGGSSGGGGASGRW